MKAESARKFFASVLLAPDVRPQAPCKRATERSEALSKSQEERNGCEKIPMRTWLSFMVVRVLRMGIYYKTKQ